MKLKVVNFSNCYFPYSNDIVAHIHIHTYLNQKRGDSEFPHKKRGVGKIGRVVLKKG